MMTRIERTKLKYRCFSHKGDRDHREVVQLHHLSVTSPLLRDVFLFSGQEFFCLRRRETELTEITEQANKKGRLLRLFRYFRLFRFSLSFFWLQLCCFLLFVAALLLCASNSQAQTPLRETMTRELQEVARVATVMMDGDLCQRIMTERALKKLFVKDPEDQWAGADNFDVNAEAFVQAKKTLMRLARLQPYPIDCNLWMLFKEDPKRIQILIRNQYEMGQFWRWGVLYQDIPPDMAEVIASGKPKTIGNNDLVSVLTPVYNSLGDIVGLVEVVARARPDWHENVK